MPRYTEYGSSAACCTSIVSSGFSIVCIFVHISAYSYSTIILDHARLWAVRRLTSAVQIIRRTFVSRILRLGFRCESTSEVPLSRSASDWDPWLYGRVVGDAPPSKRLGVGCFFRLRPSLVCNTQMRAHIVVKSPSSMIAEGHFGSRTNIRHIVWTTTGLTALPVAW